MVVGLFVVYRMALFEHRVLFDVGDAVEDLAISDFDELLAAEVGSATSAGDGPVLVSITGGGDQEANDVSPPSKRRKKGKGRAKQLDRRRKSSKSNLDKDVNIAPEESGETEIEIENVTPTTSPRLDKKAAWRKSPQGRASIAASNRKYETSPLARSTRRRYETSEEGIEKRRRYESLQERKELKRRNESTEMRRRYRSTEGRFIRAKYGKTKHGRESRKRAIHKYGNTEGGRESHARARKKYELKEAAQKRKLRYKQRKAYYNRRVKKAMKHLSAKAVEITEPQRTDDDDQTDENPIHSEDGAENSCSNKEAMATIRSHKVCHF